MFIYLVVTFHIFFPQYFTYVYHCLALSYVPLHSSFFFLKKKVAFMLHSPISFVDMWGGGYLGEGFRAAYRCSANTTQLEMRFEIVSP